MGKTSEATKKRIVNAAWHLFYRHGYENTTIEDIIEEAHISKGSFYHYFTCKDDMIGAITILLDDKYEGIFANLPENMDPLEKLITMTRDSFFIIENTVPVYMLSVILANQLNNRTYSSMLDPDRSYYRLARQIIIEAKAKGTFKGDTSVNELLIAYALFERGLMYDWCISNGNYSFSNYAERMMRVFLNGFTV